jgi:hypothetical protein
LSSIISSSITGNAVSSENFLRWIPRHTGELPDSFISFTLIYAD